MAYTGLTQHMATFSQGDPCLQTVITSFLSLSLSFFAQLPLEMRANKETEYSHSSKSVVSLEKSERVCKKQMSWQMNPGPTVVLQVLLPCPHSFPELTLYAFGSFYFKEKQKESQSKLQIPECFLRFGQSYCVIGHKLVMLDPTPRQSSASISQKSVHLDTAFMWVCRARTCIQLSFLDVATESQKWFL